ncbi:hypothetical protein [Glutamicibacter soli]
MAIREKSGLIDGSWSFETKTTGISVPSDKSSGTRPVVGVQPIPKRLSRPELLEIALSTLASNGGRTAARIAELHRKLAKQGERASGAERKFHQAQAAMVAIEQEIAQLEQG